MESELTRIYIFFQLENLFSLRRARRLMILLMDMRELSSARESLKEEWF